MLTGRVAMAADRLAALSTRLEQLDERLRRLEAGECSSAEDLLSARRNALRQQRLAAKAEAVLGSVRRELAEASASRGAGRRGAESGRATVGRTTPPVQAVSAESLCGSSVRYWRAVMEEARHRGWRDWCGAFCRVGVGLLPSIRGVAISVIIDGLPRPLATSDVWTYQLEQAQQVLGEGPALVADLSGRPVAVRLDDPADDNWIVWSDVGLSWGAREVWCFPYRLPGLGVVVTFCRRQVGVLDHEWVEASVLSELAVRALTADARRGLSTEPGTPDLVDVATGVLAERLHLSPVDAFACLRAGAFAADHDLVQVATAVLRGAFRPN